MSQARKALQTMAAWYAEHVYGRLEGLGRAPFYVDPQRVGKFAVAPAALARGDEAALFSTLVTLTMYQSRRDVDIMAKQRAMPTRVATGLVNPKRLALAVAQHRCVHVQTAQAFDAGCDVYRDFARDRTTCGTRPRTPCHVKEATHAIARMGQLGKVPTSALLHLRAAGGLNQLFADVCAAHASPIARAEAMVARLANIFHVGTKLASFYVSALATPALAPGLTPWFPQLDGNHLLVIDANVRRAVQRLKPRGPQTYRAHDAWLRHHAAQIDLRAIYRAWPTHSPRLLQQTVYWYRSRANRDAAGLPCDAIAHACVPRVCPYHE